MSVCYIKKSKIIFILKHLYVINQQLLYKAVVGEKREWEKLEIKKI